MWNPHPKQLEFFNRKEDIVLWGGGSPSRSQWIRKIFIEGRKLLHMNNYEVDSRMAARLENDYKYHSPIADQQERYVAIREKAKELAYLIVRNTPPCREQSVSLTELDHVVMMANASIARNEKPVTTTSGDSK